MENEKIMLNNILNNENDINMLFEFFTNLYYKNDLLSLTDSNSFNYNLGLVDIIDIINSINENNLNVKIDFDF